MARGGARPGAGRPVNAAKLEVLELRERLKSLAPKLIEELERLAFRGETEQTRFAAIKELLDRAYGKPPQALTGEGGAGPITVEWLKSGA